VFLCCSPSSLILLLSILSFTPETYFLWGSSAHYNLLVASTSLRCKTAAFLCMDEFVCTQLGAYLPLLSSPYPLRTCFISPSSCLGQLFCLLLPIQCTTHRNPIWARRRSYLDARLGNCIVRGSKSGCYGRVGVCRSRTRVATCPVHPPCYFSFVTPPYLCPH
jgi:hypothetical protein